MRGLAALSVAIFHARVTLWVGWREIQAHPADFSAFDRALAWLSIPTPFFGAGVMLFFVISGFCVHQPIVAATRTPLWGAFWRRRFVRVYLPFLAAVLLSGAVIFALEGRAVHALPSAFMVQNYAGAWTETAHASQVTSNPSLWSLPVEMEFYLLYPLVWWLACRRGWLTLFAVVGLISGAAIVAHRAGLERLDGNFALYWAVWCAGAWLRECHVRRTLRRPPASVTLAAVVAVGLAIWLTVRGNPALTPLAWGAVSIWLVWRALTGPLPAPRWLMRALESMGAWSYSLYLVHFPLLLLAGVAWTGVFGTKPANFLVPLIGVAAVVPCAILFHRAIERPSHAWARRAGTLPR